jgi:hypothetical protein
MITTFWSHNGWRLRFLFIAVGSWGKKRKTKESLRRKKNKQGNEEPGRDLIY